VGGGRKADSLVLGRDGLGLEVRANCTLDPRAKRKFGIFTQYHECWDRSLSGPREWPARRKTAPFGLRRGGRGPRQISSPMHDHQADWRAAPGASPSSIFLVRARHATTQTNIMGRKPSLVSRRAKNPRWLGWAAGDVVRVVVRGL